ncbi:MAG TPA: trehalose-phosphatase [Phycisphaerae bacterium]|nr:trehalose-phosphatase [Phycisphaerae bacterium]
MSDLKEKLDQLSQSPVLLIAADYDGTLAPIVTDPDRAEAVRESIVALKALTAMPQTRVAVISGRALADLAKRVREADEAHLVGSHGSEFEAGFVTPLPPERIGLLQKIVNVAHEISAAMPGTMVEAKPASVAFHFRNAEDAAGQKAAVEFVAAIGQFPDVQIRHGKKVVEVSVVHTDKGVALQQLRQRLGATGVLFIGDDVTDEDAFRTLSGPDLGVKVGEGDTVAKFRIADTVEVARLLAELAERRGEWIAGSAAVPIEHHSLLSDQRTCALVTPRGRISWMCLPRLDSPALFAELIGGPSAGFFEVVPEDARSTPRQSYDGTTFVLTTDWDGVRVTDYLDCSAGRPFQRAGRSELIRVIEGRGKVHITFAPRLDFGGVETRLRVEDSGVRVEGTVEPCVLYAPGVHWTMQREGRHDTVRGEIDLGTDPVLLELRYGTANLMASKLPEPRRRAQTQHHWTSWASTLALPRLCRDLVERSALVLHALVYGPTGAIAAAATTSLPEHLGGVRNWDYRFCWPRDAAMAASALARLDSPGAAMRLLDWVLGLFEEAEPDAFLRPLYTLTGGHLGPEGILAELSGYRGSRPVRIGNGAAHQIQLDVLGPVAELLALKAHQGAPLSAEHWRLTESMVKAVSLRWMEEDHGIWEIRGPRKHHVHSKVTCWQTVDCALKVAEYMGERRSDWHLLRDTIAHDVLDHGWNATKGSFCSTYGGSDVDAAVLFVGLSGLLQPNDPRFLSTIKVVEQELREGPVVFRYRFDDGLPGTEGGFNICTSWLIQSYMLAGRAGEAMELFRQYISLAGPTGLMAEEYDPHRRLALGNFPQAYSHIGLINAALCLEGTT